MSDYTYHLTFTKEQFHAGILQELKRVGETELYRLLKGSRLSIDDLGTSYYAPGGGKSRWDAVGINITFHVNPGNIDALDTEHYKATLFSICDKYIPGEVGYDLKAIVFVQDLSIDFNADENILTDLENQVSHNSNSILKKILPEDIREKGIYMAEVYTYLYSVENSLRVFIELVGQENYGEQYMDKLNFPRALQTTISKRKEKALEQKWLSLRGNNDLFYLDFKDIGTLIENNWDIFKKYFVTQDFILPKINEMADCRNLIAHNSYVSKTERDLLKSYYNSILRQIEHKFQ